MKALGCCHAWGWGWRGWQDPAVVHGSLSAGQDTSWRAPEGLSVPRLGSHSGRAGWNSCWRLRSGDVHLTGWYKGCVSTFVFFCFCKLPDHSLSAGWLCGGDVAEKVRREVSSASPGLGWELKELARSVSALTPWRMQTLSRALYSPQHDDTGVSGLTGTAGTQSQLAGIQRLVNEVGMAGSQIKLKIAPGFLNYPRLFVLEQEKDLRQTH